MKALSYKKVDSRIQLELFGIKITHKIPMKLNYIISLGTNCFVRTILTLEGIKPRKEQGELSCPFDLCQLPSKSLAQILENDFCDFFDSIYFNLKDKCWINKKYTIAFPHDAELTFEQLNKRYLKRIENFRKISNSKSFKKYIHFCWDENCEPFSVDDLNRIYSALLKIRSGKKFKLIVLCVKNSQTPDLDIKDLHPNIKYCEYKIDNFDEFLSNWWKKEYITKNSSQTIIQQMAKHIK